MKIKYNLGLLILFLVVLSLKTSIVQAQTSCNNIKLKANNSLDEFSFATNIKMDYNNRDPKQYPHPYYLSYNFLDNVNNYIFGYCQNPNLSTGRTDSKSYFKCNRILFDQDNTNEKQQMIEAGIVYLLRNNNQKIKDCNYHNHSDCYQYVVHSLALRIYDMFFAELNNNTTPDYSGKLYAHESFANQFIKDNEIRNLIYQIKGEYPTEFTDKNVTYYEYNKFMRTGTDYTEDEDITSNVKNDVKKLLMEALQAGLNYKEEVKTPTIKLIPTADGKNYTELETVIKGNNISKEIIYTFELQNFSNDSFASVYAIVYCENCNANKVTWIQVINDGQTNHSISENMLNYGRENQIKIRVILNHYTTPYNCEKDLKLKVVFNYTDPGNSGKVYEMYSENAFDKNGNLKPGNYQKFYVYLDNNDSNTITFEDAINICDHDCDYYLDLCNKGDNAACEKVITKKCKINCNILNTLCERGITSACEQYNKDCKNCTTEIINTECSNTGLNNEITIKEGYKVDYSKCDYSSSPQILSCIIDNSDVNGNSYKATDLSNSYCSVYCKEDYHLSLPGNKSINSGRYFSLRAGVSGTKYCYTSKINTTTFNDDLESARKAVIDAYNEWSNYYNGVHNHGSNLTPNAKTGAKHDAHCITSICTIKPKEGEACPANKLRCTSSCKGNQASSYYGYSYTWKYDAYTYDGTKQVLDGLYSSPGSTSCTHDSCGSVSGSDIGSTYNETSLASKANALNAAINNYVGIINSYNSCSGKNTIKYDSTLTSSNDNGWLMEYNYEPTIKYWYEENYMNNVIKDTLDTIGEINKSEISQKVCAGDVSENYETCTGNWTNSLTSSTKSQFVCRSTNSGYTCGNVSLSISNAKYVKQEISASSSYITPTQFYTIYPTGAIVVAQEGTQIENGSPLPNGLPVSYSAGRSIKSYALTIDNLGEYYDTKNLGRIWSNGKNVLARTLEDSKACQSGALNYQVEIGSATFKNGVYVCKYTIDCPDCPQGYVCVKTKDGYYGKNGTIVSEAVYNSECCPTCPTEYKCVRTSAGYYGAFGTIVSESVYKEQCCPENECPVICIDCLKDNFIYRPITSENINPNDRELGVNWKFDEKNIKTGLELKAYATTTEIQTNGNSIYDVNFDSTTNKDFAIEITMDAKMISKLRDINDNLESKGGYLTNTLKCYDYTSADGKTYKNMFCYSTIIDELLSDNNYKNNIKISVERPLKETERNNYQATNNYWTTWYEAVSKNNWTTKTTYALNIGPAWK